MMKSNAVLLLLSSLFGVNSFPAFPHGTLSQDGYCHITKQSNLSWIWDYPSENNSFYTIQPLEEEPYRSYEHIKDPPTFSFSMPQEFITVRHPPSEQDKIYGRFPELKENYALVEHTHNLTYLHEFYSFLLYMHYNQRHRMLAIAENVYSTHRGLIVSAKTCQYLRNGGCVYMFHETNFEMNANIDRSIRKFEQVIALGTGASGTWHFPMEVFVGLAGLPESILTNPQVMFHLPRHNDYVMSWMQLLQIPPERCLFDEVIYSKKVYLPEQGRCGEIYHSQIEWLNARFNPLPLVQQQVSTQRQILYIHRSGSRKVSNAHEVKRIVQSFASQHHYQFIEHGDGLPSLPQQIERFARAPIIIAPHGAALLFTAFSPGNACIREWMPHINPECYARIAYMKRLNYRMYMMLGSSFNVSHVEMGLTECHAHFEASIQRLPVSNSNSSSHASAIVPEGRNSGHHASVSTGSGTSSLHSNSHRHRSHYHPPNN